MKIEKKNHFSVFNFEVKTEMRKNVLFHSNFKMKIEWHFRCTDSSCLLQNLLFTLLWRKWYFKHLAYYFFPSKCVMSVRVNIVGHGSSDFFVSLQQLFNYQSLCLLFITSKAPCILISYTYVSLHPVILLFLLFTNRV